VPSFALFGTYQAQIGGPSACSQYDQVVASTGVNITDGILQLSLANGFRPTVGQTFTIINNTGSSAVSGVFEGVPEGTTVSGGGYDFKLSYVGGTGNDVTLTTIGLSGTSSTGAGSNDGTTTPGTPNTGLAGLVAHPLTTLAAAITAAVVIVGIARRLRPVKQ
jgi:hypothetical protein